MALRVSSPASGVLLLVALSSLASCSRGSEPAPAPQAVLRLSSQESEAPSPSPLEALPTSPTADKRAIWVVDDGHEEVERFLAQKGEVIWTTAAGLFAAGTESCVDGRSEAPVLGTPGGDVGDLLLSLAALESVTGKPVTSDRLDALVDAYVASFGRFYLHTDAHALFRLRDSLRKKPGFAALEGAQTAEEIRRFVLAPPAELEQPLLDALTLPEHVGCGHLRLQLASPALYGARGGLPRSVLQAVFRHAFDHPEDLDFVVLDGEHEERGVLLVRQRAPVEAHTRVPMVTPHGALAEYFVFHPDVANYIRKETADFLAERHEELGVPEPDRAALDRAVERLGAQQLEATLKRLAPRLPHVEVRLSEEARPARRAGRETSARR